MEPSRSLSLLLERSGAVGAAWTRACPVEEREWRLFEDWLDRGFDADMNYMRNYPEIRKDPRLLLEGGRSIVSIAYNYRQPNPFPGVATYALGEDYHKVLRRRLKKVVATMKQAAGGEWRICIDSAPMLERYWARKSGLGRRSDLHGNICIPGVGSMVFLAELITTLDLGEGRWHKFPSADSSAFEANIPYPCPTGALCPGGTVDARRCINYLTIEHRGELDETQKKMVGDCVFGCDKCQTACPSNGAPWPGVLPEFEPLPGLKEYLEGQKEALDLRKSPINRAVKRNFE